MTNEQIVRLTINHVLDIIGVAAAGAARADHVSEASMRGVHDALQKKIDSITADVLEKIG